jgi:hypothetical protein
MFAIHSNFHHQQMQTMVKNGKLEINKIIQSRDSKIIIHTISTDQVHLYLLSITFIPNNNKSYEFQYVIDSKELTNILEWKTLSQFLTFVQEHSPKLRIMAKKRSSTKKKRLISKSKSKSKSKLTRRKI